MFLPFLGDVEYAEKWVLNYVLPNITYSKINQSSSIEKIKPDKSCICYKERF